MNESGFTDGQKVDAELERQSGWCCGMGPKAPGRECSECPGNGEVAGVYGGTVVRNEK